MTYYFFGILNVLTIISLSNAINKLFLIRAKYTILITILLISFLILLSFKISIFFLDFFIFKELYLFSLILSFYFFLKFRVYHLKQLDRSYLDFFFISILILVSSYNNYFLDEDEFQYYGIILKFLKGLTSDQNNVNFFYENLANKNYQNIFTDFYTSTTIYFNFYNILLTDYSENLLIFSSNLIIVSSFIFLIDPKWKLLHKSLIFVIFYTLLNNFSFGLMSIYPDAILICLFACSIKFLDDIKKGELLKFNNIFIIIILCLSLYLTKRSGVIYSTFVIILILYFKNFLNFNLVKKIILILIFFIILAFIKLELWNGLELVNFSKNFILQDINLLINNFILMLNTPIYFSNFLISAKYFFSLFDVQLQIASFSLSIFLWFLYLIINSIILNKDKSFTLYITLCFIIFSLFLIIWNEFHGLHFLTYGRYMGILICSFLMYLFLRIENLDGMKKINKIILLFSVITLFSFTPNKSFGFFLNDKLYHSKHENLIFNENRLAIKKNIISSDKVYFIYNENYENISIYHTILKYEFFKGNLNFNNHLFLNEIENISTIEEDTEVFVIKFKNSELSESIKNFLKLHKKYKIVNLI